MTRTLQILCFVLMAVLVPARAWGQDLSADAKRSIHVDGEAEVKVAPDEIVLTLGIETSDRDLLKSKSLNDDSTRRVISSLQKAGIQDRHIQTDFLEIEPRYEPIRRPENFIGYFVRKTIVVTIKDVPKFEEVLSSSLSSGANYVLGIQFQTTNLRKHRDEARALAIRAAREKAQALAAQLNQKIGQPINISESGSRWYSWYGRSWWGSRYSGMQAQNVVQNLGGDNMPEDGIISPGRISVYASVRVTFELQ